MTGKQISLEQLLQCAVMASWPELTPAETPTLVRIEYQVGGRAPLEFVKIWSSIKRGYWSLVCEYWPTALWTPPWGVAFSNGHYSDRLIQVFATLTQHLEQFPKASSSDADAFILIENVAEEDQAAAQKCLSKILGAADLASFSATLGQVHMSNLKTTLPREAVNPPEHITGACGSAETNEKRVNQNAECDTFSANLALLQPAETLSSYWE